MIEFNATRHRMHCVRCGRIGVWLDSRETAERNDLLHAQHCDQTTATAATEPQKEISHGNSI